MSCDHAHLTPDTTIADLLEQHPDLDAALAALVPTYAALPPAVRRSVAGSFTLHRLATLSGLGVGRLITELRAAAGLADTSPTGDELPEWIRSATAVTRLDARPILAAGAHPVAEVMHGLSALGDGAVFELVTPFVPAPLVDMARGRGFDAHSRWDGDIVRTCFTRRRP